MRAIIFLEGGGSGPYSKVLQTLCRQSFRILLENCGLKGRMPHLAACGPRNETYNDFVTEMTKRDYGYIAMWIDSEDPISNPEEVWKHLTSRDQWQKPNGAKDDQVLLMTTCMETLIVADHEALKVHYGSNLQGSGLPTADFENRPRQTVQKELEMATRNCSNAYAKGKRSFEILAKLNPDTLQKHLPSFARTRRILNQKLG